MKIIKTKFKGVFLLNPIKHKDSRGYFSETFSKNKIRQFKNLDFVQDSQSFTYNKYVFRGLHYQSNPYAQDKLVGVLNGEILDIILDIRKNSSTFGKHLCLKISSDNFNQIFIPKGYAHGFLTLKKNTKIFYKFTNYYAPNNSFGINVNDPELKINFPVKFNKIAFSKKDKYLPKFKKTNYYFD